MTRCFGLGKVKGGHKYEIFLFNFWMFQVKLIILRGTFFTLTKIIIFMEWPDPRPPLFGKFHKNYYYFFWNLPLDLINDFNGPLWSWFIRVKALDMTFTAFWWAVRYGLVAGWVGGFCWNQWSAKADQYFSNYIFFLNLPLKIVRVL